MGIWAGVGDSEVFGFEWFRVQGLGCRGFGLEFRAWDFGFGFGFGG